LLVGSSTLTVLAGGIDVASARLGADNTTHGHVRVPVPAALIGGNGLALSVRTYLRLTESDCEDPGNPALWATVHASSTVQLSTVSRPPDLGDVPALLTGAGAGQAVQLALPVSPDPDVVRAAGIAAADIGHWQADRRDDALVGLASPLDPGRATVFVAPGPAVPAGFPVTWNGTALATGGEDLPGGHGVLALAEDRPARLLVGGATPAAVLEAAEALEGPLSGRVAALTGQPVAPVVADADPWRHGAASFAQLGIDRQEVAGPGRREVTLQIDRPPGWTLTGHPRLDLVIDTAATLDEQASSIQVELAGIDLGSRRVHAGGPHTYSFDIPAGLANRQLDGRAVRSLDLTARLLLQPAHQPCQPFDVEAVRAAILPTSAFFLPHADFGGREVGRFPHPVLDTPARQAVVVLPRSPDIATVAAGIQLCADLGRWSEPGAPPPLLTTTDNLSPAQRGSGGLFLLGDADTELLGRPVDIGRPQVVPGRDQSAAVLGRVPSPFDASRAALVVHGDGAGLLLAARTLSSRVRLAEMRGSRVAVVGAAPALTLLDIGHPSPPPELRPVVGGRSLVRQRWAVPAIVLLTAFLAVLFLVARFRWWRPRRKSPA
jgi:hypothetical protein